MTTSLKVVRTVVALMLLALPAWAGAQARPLEDRRLGITHVEVNPSVREGAENRGAKESLARVSESMDAQMISAFDSIKKFEIVSWSDLKKIVDVGAANQALGGAEGFKYAGCRYSVQVKIDDFQDIQRTVELAALGETHLQRQVRVSAVVIVYDTTNGKVFTTTNIQLDSNTQAEPLSNPTARAQSTERMLIDLGRNLAELTAYRVADVIFPTKVVARTDKVVTLNRGDAFRYQPGMVFEIFSLGEELIDPDTGRRLGNQEEKIGAVRVVSVTPETCVCEVVEETRPISRGQIARLPGGQQGGGQQQR